MGSRRVPAFWRVLKHDYACFMFAIIGPIFLVIGAVTLFFGKLPTKRGVKPVNPAFAWYCMGAAAFVTVLFLGLLAVRYARLRQILWAGEEVEATVVWVWFEKDRGRVEYEYEWKGTAYRSGRAIMKTQETRNLAPGDLLRVSVDPSKPSIAVPFGFFCAQAGADPSGS